MVTLKVTVEDDQAEALKKMLCDLPAVKSIEEQQEEVNQLQELETPYERIKKILDSAKGKNLFADIKDPSEWQREIRKEWDRDY